MDECLRSELLAKTKEALEEDDWGAVMDLWRPWVEKGDAEAEFQLAYNYLWCTPCDDDATRDEMKGLLRRAAAKNHPDAIWFLATREYGNEEKSPDLAQELLRAGELGSMHAQRALGVAYATGEWYGPKDLAEARRWYRLAAEQGESMSQYDLGFMMLLGEGGPKDIDEGLMWLERAGEQGEFCAFRLLVDCYENGYCDVPVHAEKAGIWRSRLEEYHRLNPPKPSRTYSVDGGDSHLPFECVMEIDGVTGGGFLFDANRLFVSYEPEEITPAELDEQIRAVLPSASPIEP